MISNYIIEFIDKALYRNGLDIILQLRLMQPEKRTIFIG